MTIRKTEAMKRTMKKAVLLVIAFLGIVTEGFSQNVADALYLKGGSKTTPDYRKLSKEAPLLRGYKGFVDIGYTFRSGWGCDRTEVSTSHGYQFNNFLFLGGGVGVHYYADREYVAFPMFVNFRVNYTKYRITPFGDVKAGYAIGDFDGTYLALAGGVRFALKRKQACFVSIGYSAQEVGVYDEYAYDAIVKVSKGVSLKFGFEF